MKEDTVLAYVDAAAAVLALPLAPERAARVAAHLGRTAAMAELLDNVDMGPELEPAEVYCPAPFPQAGEGGAA